MCVIDNFSDDLSEDYCYRSCHTEDSFPIEVKCSNYEPEQEGKIVLHNYLEYFVFNLKVIDDYQEYVGPSNLPKDPGCKPLDVPASICDDFTKYRVLLCGGSVWQQAQCYKGDCNADRWPDQTTNGCQYAVVRRGVALCPSNPQFSCRFICRKKNGTCSKKVKKYPNTSSGRQLMSKNFNITTNDWKKLDNGLSD